MGGMSGFRGVLSGVDSKISKVSEASATVAEVKGFAKAVAFSKRKG
jgi:hypothetical protein